MENLIPLAAIAVIYFLMKKVNMKIRIILSTIATLFFIYLSVTESENRYFNLLLVILGVFFIVKNVKSFYFKKDI
jgi:O-antigen ligase